MAELFNASAFLIDRQIGRGLGGHTAVTGPRARLDYEQLADLVEKVAGGLRTAGLRPEERIVLVTADGPEMLAVILAAMRIGAVPVPVSTMYRGAELATLIRDSRARFLVVSAEFAEAARQAVIGARDLRTVITIGDGALPVPARIDSVTWEQFVALDGDGRPDATTGESPALWLYTSGTTGTPKAVMHRHASIRHVVEGYGAHVLAARSEDRFFSVAKLFFAYGLGNSCFFPLAAGAAVILDAARPTAQSVTRRLIEDRPTLFFASPTMYATLLHDPAVPDDAFASVRAAISAGESLPEHLARRFRERFGIDLTNGVGSTEALHIYLSGGKPVPGYEVRLVTQDGALAAPGAPGALQVRGPSAATGYWCRAEETRSLFDGDWMVTGDYYDGDATDGYRYLGRGGHMLKAGGIWVSPHEVEARLLEHPAVAQAVLVAVPDADSLDKPVACLVPAPGHTIDPEEIVEFCRSALASFKRPRHVLVLSTLPTSATGKIRRDAVQADAARALAAPTPTPDLTEAAP